MQPGAATAEVWLSDHAMNELEARLLQPRYAVCSFCEDDPEGCASITVNLRPFKLDGESINTDLCVDGVALGCHDFAALAGREYHFVPLADNAPEASLYLRGRHHPVDVTTVAFGPLGDDEMPLHLRGSIEYTAFHSGDTHAVPFDWHTRLRLPASATALQRIVDRAVAQAGTSGPRDMGRVMAMVRPQLVYDEQTAALAWLVKARLGVH